jgi:type II secretory pathway pseudopilin PulG
MRKWIVGFMLLVIAPVLGASSCVSESNQEQKDKAAVQRQQSQYGKAQPVPTFNWSLERDLVIQLYNLRNQRAATHSVWRSDHGMIEGDCPSMGFGIPYDTSLTNPLQTVSGHQSLATIGQAEPNGVFASTNTVATWVMCVGAGGVIEPVYIETKVTVYPGSVHVDYETNRVTRTGKPSVTIKKRK